MSARYRPRRDPAADGDLGIAFNGVRSARLGRLNSDDDLDLVVVGTHRLSVWPGNDDGGFDPLSYTRPLRAGT